MESITLIMEAEEHKIFQLSLECTRGSLRSVRYVDCLFEPGVRLVHSDC